MYTYHIEGITVIDGDTVKLNRIKLGFNISLTNQIIRIKGIDSPESRTKDLEEKKYGLMAKNRLIELLTPNSLLISFEGSHDKYGRISGDFIVPSHELSVSEILINEHLAVRYDGKSKKQIEHEHMKNRLILGEYS